MPFLIAFWKPIAGIVALLALGLAIMAVKHSYDDGKRDEGRTEVRAAVSEETHKECGEKAETPGDCFKAGVASVQAELAAKITAANRTIVDTQAALESANRSIDALKADSAKRAAAASAALAALETRAKDAADKLAALQIAQPIPGVTPCESACSLLRSSW